MAAGSHRRFSNCGGCIDAAEARCAGVEAEEKADVPTLEQNVRLLSETSVSMSELALQSTDETNSGACRRRGLLPADASHRLFDLRQLCGKYNRLLEKLPAKIVGRLLGFRNAEILSREAIDSLIRQGISR